MEETIEKIRQRIELLKTEIQKEMEQQNINASGRTSQALKVVVGENSVKLIKAKGDNAPMETLEIGRPGGNFPKGFYHIIKQWSIDKKIRFRNESERSTFAYFVAKKIAKDGTERYRNNTDVYSMHTQKAVEDIRKIIGAEIRNVIKNNFPKR